MTSIHTDLSMPLIPSILKRKPDNLNRTFLGAIFSCIHYCPRKRCLYPLPPIPLLPFFPAALPKTPPTTAQPVAIPTAPPVTLRWANPTVSSQSPPYWTCQRSLRQAATLSPLLELPASPGFPDPHAWFSFLSLVIPSQSQPLVSPHLPASPCWRGPGPRPQSLH